MESEIKLKSMWPFKEKHKKLTQDQQVFIERVVRLIMDFMEQGFIVKQDRITRDDEGGIAVKFSIKSRPEFIK